MGTRSGGAASRQASSLLRPTSAAIMVAIAAGRATQQEVGERLGIDADTAAFVRATNNNDFKKASSAFMKVAGKAVIAGASGFVVSAAITYVGFKLIDFANKAARRMSPGEAGAYLQNIRRGNINLFGRNVNLGDFANAAFVWARNNIGAGYYDAFTGRFVRMNPNSYPQERPRQQTSRGPAEAREARPNTQLPNRVNTADLRRLMSDIEAEARRNSRGTS